MNPSTVSTGHVVSVNVSSTKGVSKTPVATIALNATGVSGDAHAGPWVRQVSLLASESIERFAAASGRTFSPGDFAENITTAGLDLMAMAPLDRIVAGDVEFEVTQLGKKCHGDGCAIFQQVGKCVMPKEGIFCRVLRGGALKAGDSMTYHPRMMRIVVITLSDRAAGGFYEDRSGPAVVQCLERHYTGMKRQPLVDTTLLPDDGMLLRDALEQARDTGVDVVITTGGTGLGPRDCAPDVVVALADRVIPGIMEHIRALYGANKPNALLSRSVAALLDKTLVYALPGSVNAVNEYMAEILKTMDHLRDMVHGLDDH